MATREMRTAIVTGAGNGIGAAVARRLATDGARVVVNDFDDDALAEVVASLPGEHVTVGGDVALEETARRLTQTALDVSGRIDVLVNNAGMHFIRDIEETSADEWDRVMAVNLRSMFLCCKHVIPVMQQQRSGSIINVASISSFIGQEFDGVSTFAYNVSKAGARQLAVSLASRYAADGIRVNTVCPGATRTQQLRHENPQLTANEEAAMWEGAGASTPVGRVARPEEIASLIAYLASAEAEFITGSSMVIDGGYLAR